MISRYAVWLNDIALTAISPAIYISDIAYQAASPSRSTSAYAGGDGQYSSDTDTIDANRIAVTFMIREYNTQRRQFVLQDVIAWAAKGGWLETSDRFGQHIYVRCTRIPGITSVMRWTDSLQIEFTAYDYPFWTDKEPVEVSVNAGETGTLFLHGVRKSCVEAVISSSDPIGSVSLTCGDTSIQLSNLGLSANSVITIDYTDNHHILQIKSGDVSLLANRDPASDDDLIAEVGENALSFQSDSASAVCLFKVKGVYL